MKKIIFVIWGCLWLTYGLKAQEAKEAKFAVSSEFSHRNAGIGIQYRLQERWFIPLMAGISNEFNERKWNDWYVDIQPYYLFGHRRIQFPVGILGGVRFIDDYGHHFPVFFYGGYGGGLYRTGRHGIQLHVGVKFGKKYHLLRQSETWGQVEAYETYKEKLFFFTLGYQYYF